MSDDRISMIHERPQVTEARFAALCRALAPAQSHSAGLRSVAYGAQGSGGLRETTADERAIDAGAVTRGRRASARVAATRGRARATLVWLTTYAHAGDLGTLAVVYADAAAPEALRTRRDQARAARDAAAVAAREAQTAHDAAKRVAVSRAPEAIVRAIAAKATADAATGRRESADATLARVEAALAAWGRRALCEAVEAWEDAGEEARVA